MESSLLNITNKSNINDFYSCRNCFNQLNSNDPASQYQKQKIIQNTVRVPSSLYTMNLEGLAGYKQPLTTGQYVSQSGAVYYVPPNTYWNQQSDRPVPSQQVAKTASGATYHSSSTKHSITRLRPGAMSPGGNGVDIKHNSYDRYLNKLKGKGPLKRGTIPATFGLPIPFTNVAPVYGGKTMKTNIVSGCNCSTNGITESTIWQQPQSSIQSQIFGVTYHFSVGDYVWAQKNGNNGTYYKAQIIEINGLNYLIQFSDDSTMIVTSPNNLLVYFNCQCANEAPLIDQILDGQYTADAFESSNLCVLTNAAVNAPYL